MENILYNLLSNAFKNTPVSGSIKMIVNFVEHEVEKCIPAPFVSICIKDSGSGIAKEHLPYIFDRFYKAGQENTEKSFSSSGIGLALTYEIVQALHGEIKAESEPGRGSSFTVYIPFTKNRFNDDEINQTASPVEINMEGRINELKEDIIIKESGYENEEEMPGDKLKPVVLIVEDNIDLRSFLMQTLHHSYRVLEAENGKTGFEIASVEIPDIIVSDVMMPVMDGIEMCKILKQDVRTSHIPVVLLTAKGSVHDQKTGYDAGADSYLTKPFSSNLLMSRLKNILEARKKLWLVNSSGFKDKRQILNDSIGELDKDFLKKLTEVIEGNLEDEEMNISYIATQMNMSHSTLYRKIKALTNLTANEFIRKVRINFAEQLLLTNKYNISEIMYRIGINSSSYFRQCFKEEFGMNPSEYLQKLKEN
jgi:DNA-binding response OmpR family regulator